MEERGKHKRIAGDREFIAAKICSVLQVSPEILSSPRACVKEADGYFDSELRVARVRQRKGSGSRAMVPSPPRSEGNEGDEEKENP